MNKSSIWASWGAIFLAVVATALITLFGCYMGYLEWRLYSSLSGNETSISEVKETVSKIEMRLQQVERSNQWKTSCTCDNEQIVKIKDRITKLEEVKPAPAPVVIPTPIPPTPVPKPAPRPVNPGAKPTGSSWRSERRIPDWLPYEQGRKDIDPNIPSYYPYSKSRYCPYCGYVWSKCDCSSSKLGIFGGG